MAKTQQFSETDAMKAVEEALDQIDEGARRRVMTWAFSKYSPGGSGSSVPPIPSQPQILSKAPQPGTNIKSFMNSKKPANSYERVACLAYYLEKVDALEEIKTADISKANTDARLSKLSNTALFVGDATRKYGYLTSIGRGKVALSTRGEAVVEALPNRERVEEALEANPFRRGGKKKKAGTK